MAVDMPQSAPWDAAKTRATEGESAAMRPAAAPRGKPRRRFVRGTARPRGVVWFGLRSFWGHLRHLAASAIATEDIDSRDWMTPDDPRELLRRVAAVLGAPSRDAATLTQALGRDLWVDYVSDTGDDVSVSRAVARLVLSPYEVADPDDASRSFVAPRGDVLLFGGDTAYPVATAAEIQTRVVAPFNQELAEAPNRRPRVLLGIPGNHDWYDGLDGFGRMFRRRAMPGPEDVPQRGERRTRLSLYADFARQFMLGGHVHKPRALELAGYVPVQNASYFALPIAPGISLLAADRQLKEIDARQGAYFQNWLTYNLSTTPWVVLPDPVYAFGAPSATGTAMIDALGLSLRARPHLVVAGDIHHYRREMDGPTIHVTAGGGGAFLHPAPLGPRTSRPAATEWPDANQSRALLAAVPWKIAMGRSGFIPHLVISAIYSPWALSVASGVAHRWGGTAITGVATLVTAVYALIGGVRRGKNVLPILALALGTGLVTAVIPLVATRLEHALLLAADTQWPSWAIAALSLPLAAFAGAFVFGVYLALLTLFDLEATQAFTALDHPGFKHFVRFRVRADGTAVDAFCFGLEDPLGKDTQPVLVDAFTWRCR
jgi:hypothetical protein